MTFCSSILSAFTG